MNNTLRAILRSEQNIIPAGGKDYFVLDDKECIYYVLEGKADIFAVDYKDGNVSGARNHVAHLEKGRVFFGFSRDSFNAEGTGLLVNGVVDTKVIKVELSKFRKIAGDPAHSGEIAAIIDAWFELFSKSLPGKQKNEAAFRNLQIQNDQAFEQGICIQPPQGTVWLLCRKGLSRFNGIESSPVPQGEDLVVLSYPSWLETVEESVFDSFTTLDVLVRKDFWIQFERNCNVIIGSIKRHIEEEAALERERVIQRDNNLRGKIHDALSSLHAIIDPESFSLPPAETDDPMLSACRAVASYLDISIQTPDGKSRNTPAGSLASIARASRIRTRRVALKGTWWKTDSGPMIGYIAEDKRPVALLPKSPTSYEMFDPVKNERTLLTDANAVQVDYFADVMYRTFPAKMLKGWDIFRFGLMGRTLDVLTILVMGLLGGLLGLLTPIITGVIFDEVIPGVQLSQLFMLSMAMIVAGIATATFEFTRRMALLRMEGRMDQHVQGAVIDRLIELPMSFYKNFSSGDLADRAMGINAIRQVLSGTTINAIISGVFSLFNLALLYYYSTTLANWALIITAVVIIVMALTNYFQLKTQKKLAQLNGDLSGKVLEFIMGISKFRVAGAEGRAFSIWAGMFGGMKTISRKSRIIANSVDTYIAFIPIVSSMIIFFFILKMSEKEPLSIGSFLAFNASFGQFMSSTLQIMDSLVSTLSVVPMYQRSKPILMTLPETDLEKIHPGELTGRLEMNQVSFSYNEDGPLIIDSVSIRVEPGEFVAIVGPSGSGKSTLIRLLLGFEKPNTGSIFYDEQELAGLDIRAVRQQMGVVLQNGQVMSGDILTNIIGSSLLTVDDAWEAARMSGLEGDIRQMPMGMYSVVSEGGTSLSGGQKQRLLISRALARKPKILIFDEATSALDNETQATVNKSLEELNTTRIVIAHRLSTIVNAKRIYVIDRGKLVQMGTYEELIHKEGVFADIARRQIS